MTILNGLLQQTTKGKIIINKEFPSVKTEIPLNTTTYVLAVTDGPTVFSFHNGLTINQGALFTLSSRCKGMCLAVKHKLVVDGRISMTARGASSVGDTLAIDYKAGEILINPSNLNDYEWTVGSIGGNGGARVGGYSGTWWNGYGITGGAGINGACGGGGSGACSIYKCTGYSGAGGSGTSYSGGAGGGGASLHQYNWSASNGSSTGGPGGSGGARWNGTNPRGGAGGAGNGGGWSYVSGGGSAYNGASGTGGLLVILVYGDIEIGSTGLIDSDGSRGGYTTASKEKAHGGGSGGGSITILYTGNFINNGTIRANGGSGAPYTGFYGGNGGAGSIRISKITI